jgi:hypothetical protein
MRHRDSHASSAKKGDPGVKKVDKSKALAMVFEAVGMDMICYKIWCMATPQIGFLAWIRKGSRAMQTFSAAFDCRITTAFQSQHHHAVGKLGPLYVWPGATHRGVDCTMNGSDLGYRNYIDRKKQRRPHHRPYYKSGHSSRYSAASSPQEAGAK